MQKRKSVKALWRWCVSSMKHRDSIPECVRVSPHPMNGHDERRPVPVVCVGPVHFSPVRQSFGHVGEAAWEGGPVQLQARGEPLRLAEHHHSFPRTLLWRIWATPAQPQHEQTTYKRNNDTNAPLSRAAITEELCSINNTVICFFITVKLIGINE